MTSPTAKIIERLKAHNDGIAHREAQEAHQAKVDAARNLGPSPECCRRSDIKLAIFDYLIDLQKGVSFEPLQFVESQMSIDDDKPSFSWFGWREAQIKAPEGCFLHLTIKEESDNRYRFNGKFRIYTTDSSGQNQNKQQFKQKGDGSFRYADIARALSADLDRQKNAQAAQRQAVANKAEAATLFDLLDQPFTKYNGVTIMASPNAIKPVRIKIDHVADLSLAAAAEILNVLKKHGIG